MVKFVLPMKIIYNKIIPFGKKFYAINLFGILFSKGPCDCFVVNHETIHTAQIKDFLYIFFYPIYLLEWFIKLIIYRDYFTAYKNISFEREAYENEHNLNYLQNRKHFSSFRYLVRSDNIEQLNSWLLYIIFIICLIPLFLFRDYVPANELRYLSIVDESITNKSFFAFTHHGVEYADKPPLYFWLLMLCRYLAGTHFMWLYGLFSLIPAIITVRVLNFWTKESVTSEFKISSQLLLLTTGLFLALSFYLRMDMLMCMFIVLTFYEFYKIYNNNGNIRKNQWLFPLFVFLAIFTKGPFGILFPFIGTISFLLVKKKISLIGKIWGWRCWLFLLIASSAWFGAVYIEGGSQYISNLLLHQTIGRAVKSFHHAEPFYYYMICIWYCLAPWSIAVLSWIISLIVNKTKLAELQILFIVISVSDLVMLSLISSKIEVYMLPLVPFIIYSFAMSLKDLKRDIFLKIAFYITSAIFILVLPIFFIMKSKMKNDILDSSWLLLSALIFSIAGILSIVSLIKEKNKININICIKSLGLGILGSVFCIGFAMPHLNKYIGYRDLSDAVVKQVNLTGINKVKSWYIGRPENMDVFIDVPIEDITDQTYPEFLNNKTEDSFILITRLKLLKDLGNLKSNADTIGKFAIITIEK